MRMRIMKAALAELNEHGARFTMSHLAARLAISKRTLYEHFASKEELLETLVDCVFSETRSLRLQIAADPDLNMREKLFRMLTAQSKIFADVSDRVKMELNVQYPVLWEKARKNQDEQWEIINGVVQKGIEDRQFRPVFVPVLQRMLLGSVREIIDYNFLLQHRTSIEEMVAQITDIVLNGIVMTENNGQETAAKENTACRG